MAALLAVLLAVSPASALPPASDCETEATTPAITATGPAATDGGVLPVTHDPAQVRHGKGALLCSYMAAPGAPVALKLDHLEPTGAQSLSLSLKASAQTPLVLKLTEEGGAIYQLFVTLLPGEWTDVSVPLTDFQLQDGSTDADHFLDARRIVTLEIQGLANMAGAFGDLFGQQAGPQTLALDDLTFSATAAPSRSRSDGDAITLGGLGSPALYLLPVGGVDLVRVAVDGGASAVGVNSAFAEVGPRAWPGLVLPVGHLDLTRAKAVRVRLRAPGPLRFQVLLEEQDGSRYLAAGELAPTGDWQTKDFPLADFRLEPGKQDENGKLDPEQLRVIVVVADALNCLLDDRGRSSFALDSVTLLTR